MYSREAHIRRTHLRMPIQATGGRWFVDAVLDMDSRNEFEIADTAVRIQREGGGFVFAGSFDRLISQLRGTMSASYSDSNVEMRGERITHTASTGGTESEFRLDVRVRYRDHYGAPQEISETLGDAEVHEIMLRLERVRAELGTYYGYTPFRVRRTPVPEAAREEEANPPPVSEPPPPSDDPVVTVGEDTVVTAEETAAS